MDKQPALNEFEHDHEHHLLSFGIRLLLTVLIVVGLLFSLRSFLAELMLLRASSYFSSYYFDDAARMSKKIVSFDKDNTKAWGLLGKVYKEKEMMDRSAGNSAKEDEDIENSIAAYEKAFSLDPTDIRIGFEIGMLCFSKREFSKAARYFEYVRNMVAEGRSGGFGYYRMTLTMLQKCYEALGETNKAKQIQKNLEKTS